VSCQSSEKTPPWGLLPIIHKFQFTSRRNPFLRLHNRAATVPPSRETSGMGPFSDVGARNREVRFTPREQTSSAKLVTSEKCQNRAHALTLFDHLVYAQQERLRDPKAEGSCRREIEDEFEPRRLFDWQIAGFRAL
jgi:hypothetical protein